MSINLVQVNRIKVNLKLEQFSPSLLMFIMHRLSNVDWSSAAYIYILTYYCFRLACFIRLTQWINGWRLKESTQWQGSKERNKSLAVIYKTTAPTLTSCFRTSRSMWIESESSCWPDCDSSFYTDLFVTTASPKGNLL